MLSVRTRSALRAAHKYLALAAALFLLAQALSGVMLAFKDRLAAALDPAMRSSAPGAAARISPDLALARARDALPPCEPERLYFPKHERGVFLLKCSGGLIATVDQWNASVLGAAPTWRYPFELADEWHLDWRIGRSGRAIVGTLGCILAILAISGAAVWWPGRKHVARALRPAWRGNTRARLRTLHRLVGPCAATFVLLFATAGIVTAWRPWIEPAVGRILPLAEPPSVPAAAHVEGSQQALLSLATAERLALDALPGASVRDMRTRGGGFDVIQLVMNPAVEARPRAADHVWVDRRGAAVLAINTTAAEPAGTRLLGWILPAHTGEAFGLSGRIVALLNGLGVLILLLSGVIATLAPPARGAKKG